MHYYTEEQIEAAYQVWAYFANRDQSLTARLARDGEARHLADFGDVELDTLRRNISNWERRLDWNDRADREIHRIAPAVRSRVQMGLLMALPGAVTTLTRAARGEEIPKTSLMAAMGVLDRTGFSPIGTKANLGEIDTPPTVLAVSGGKDLSDYSTDELLDLLQQNASSMQRSGGQRSDGMRS